MGYVRCNRNHTLNSVIILCMSPWNSGIISRRICNIMRKLVQEYSKPEYDDYLKLMLICCDARDEQI